MGFIDVIKAKAKSDLKKIVLPEGMDRRTWEAAVMAKNEGLAEIVVLASPEMVSEFAEGLDINGITVIDPATDEKTDAYIDLLVELRKAKGMTREDAEKLVLNDFTYFGTLMIKNGVIEKEGVVRGVKKGYAWYIEQLKLHTPDPSVPLYVGGADCAETVGLIRGMVEAAGIDVQIRCMDLGCLVGAHVGPGLTLLSWVKQ